MIDNVPQAEILTIIHVLISAVVDSQVRIVRQDKSLQGE